jgi:hypothetical protein
MISCAMDYENRRQNLASFKDHLIWLIECKSNDGNRTLDIYANGAGAFHLHTNGTDPSTQHTAELLQFLKAEGFGIQWFGFMCRITW